MTDDFDHWSTPNGCHEDCPACAAETHECQNCGWRGAEERLEPIEDIFQRVDPGEPMPAGECPECGALCHEIDEATPPKAVTADALYGVLNAVRVILHLTKSKTECMAQLDALLPRMDEVLKAAEAEATDKPGSDSDSHTPQVP